MRLLAHLPEIGNIPVLVRSVGLRSLWEKANFREDGELAAQGISQSCGHRCHNEGLAFMPKMPEMKVRGRKMIVMKVSHLWSWLGVSKSQSARTQYRSALHGLVTVGERNSSQSPI